MKDKEITRIQTQGKIPLKIEVKSLPKFPLILSKHQDSKNLNLCLSMNNHYSQVTKIIIILSTKLQTLYHSKKEELFHNKSLILLHKIVFIIKGITDLLFK